MAALPRRSSNPFPLGAAIIMNAKLVLNPVSVLVGALLAAVVFLSMSQSSLQAPMPLRVEYVPHPRDYFRIEEGTTYTVPPGKTFVLAGAGLHGPSTGVSTIYVAINNAVTDFWANPSSSGGFVEAPRGLSYGPGTLIDVNDFTAGAGQSYAVGYLV